MYVRNSSFLHLDQFLGAIARGLVSSQRTLDSFGRDSLINWEENGIHPTVLKWSDCKIELPVQFNIQPKYSYKRKTGIRIAPSAEGTSKLSINIHYIETNLDEEDDLNGR